MVLPHGRAPHEFVWPSDGKPALIFECGAPNNAQLNEMASALLQAGASSVVAIRQSLLKRGDPRVFFDPEVIDVAA
jgi:hypothetical protein